MIRCRRWAGPLSLVLLLAWCAPAAAAPAGRADAPAGRADAPREDLKLKAK